jgi:thiamine pyrophosphate-dependent acetolactate synthase large subunit-like protein
MSKNMKTVAEHLVEALVAAGVRRIYGVVGDSLNSIVDAVHHNKRIEWIHVRHEEAGAFAASAEAQLTGISQSARAVAAPEIFISSMVFLMHTKLSRQCWR